MVLLLKWSTKVYHYPPGYLTYYRRHDIPERHKELKTNVYGETIATVCTVWCLLFLTLVMWTVQGLLHSCRGSEDILSLGIDKPILTSFVRHLWESRAAPLTRTFPRARLHLVVAFDIRVDDLRGQRDRGDNFLRAKRLKEVVAWAFTCHDYVAYEQVDEMWLCWSKPTLVPALTVWAYPEDHW